MIVMGRVAGAQGILGWVKLKTYTESVDGLMEFPAWWLGNEKHPWRKVEVESFAVRGKGLIAKFPGCDDRTAAEKYKGLLVAVPRSSLPQQGKDEYYWSDLIGMEVINLAGEHLGVADNLLETGANDVLCVRHGNSEILIPFIVQVIRQVDMDKKVIRVDWQADY